MKKYKFKIRGNEYDAEILSFENNVAEIEINGSHYKVELEHEVKKSKTPKLVRARVPVPSKKEQKITPHATSNINAPLPGTIIKILIKEGDTVKRGATLLVMEAMKMENNILAEKDGLISKLHVSEGDTVLQNDTLLEIS